MPTERSYDVALHVSEPPARLWVNDRLLDQGEGEFGWRYNVAERVVRLTVAEDPSRQEPVTVRCK